MRRLNLAAALASCALCAISVVSVTEGIEPCYTDALDCPTKMAVPNYSADPVELEETDAADAFEFAMASKAADVQVALKTEATVTQIDTDEAVETAEIEKKAGEQTAPKVPSEKSSSSQKRKNVSNAVSTASAMPATKKNTVPEDAQSQKKSCTITIGGVAIDYVDSYGTSAAPSSDAGIWRGSDSTTDGSFGYFIGHDYTNFGAVANLDPGANVSVTDGDGNSRDYEVIDSFVVPRDTTWSEVSDRITGYGESIAMQTCVDDGYVIVVAK